VRRATTRTEPSKCPWNAPSCRAALRAACIPSAIAWPVEVCNAALRSALLATQRRRKQYELSAANSSNWLHNTEPGRCHGLCGARIVEVIARPERFSGFTSVRQLVSPVVVAAIAKIDSAQKGKFLVNNHDFVMVGPVPANKNRGHSSRSDLT